MTEINIINRCLSLCPGEDGSVMGSLFRKGHCLGGRFSVQRGSLSRQGSLPWEGSLPRGVLCPEGGLCPHRIKNSGQTVCILQQWQIQGVTRTPLRTKIPLVSCSFWGNMYIGTPLTGNHGSAPVQECFLVDTSLSKFPKMHQPQVASVVNCGKYQ